LEQLTEILMTTELHSGVKSIIAKLLVYFSNKPGGFHTNLHVGLAPAVFASLSETQDDPNAVTDLVATLLTLADNQVKDPHTFWIGESEERLDLLLAVLEDSNNNIQLASQLVALINIYAKDMGIHQVCDKMTPEIAAVLVEVIRVGSPEARSLLYLIAETDSQVAVDIFKKTSLIDALVEKPIDVEEVTGTTQVLLKVMDHANGRAEAVGKAYADVLRRFNARNGLSENDSGTISKVCELIQTLANGEEWLMVRLGIVQEIAIISNTLQHANLIVPECVALQRRLDNIVRDRDVEETPFQCKICFVNPVNATVRPCGHTLCHFCGDRLAVQQPPKCPFCNVAMERCERIFFQ